MISHKFALHMRCWIMSLKCFRLSCGNMWSDVGSLYRRWHADAWLESYRAGLSLRDDWVTGPVPALVKGCQEVPSRPCRLSALYVSPGKLRGTMCLQLQNEQLRSHWTWRGGLLLPFSSLGPMQNWGGKESLELCLISGMFCRTAGTDVQTAAVMSTD